MANSTTKIKKRNWAFVFYPESCPDNWVEILQQTGLPIAISPLHCNDVNADGSPKKSHYHAIAVYDGPTTLNNVVTSITARLNAPNPTAIDSIKGYYRYFTHMDNPEKYQYNSIDITTINGFSIDNFVELSKHEVNEIIKDVHALVRQYNIDEYSDLLDFLVDNEYFTEYNVAISHTLLFNSYLKSRKFKNTKGINEPH